MCHDRKTRGRRSQGDEYACFICLRRITDLELDGRVDDVSDVVALCLSTVTDGPGLPRPGTRAS